jgi:hypothetical protein
MMTVVGFDPGPLVAAWLAHDAWCLSLTPKSKGGTGSEHRRTLPFNAGIDVTERLRVAQAEAADALGVDVETLVASVLAERKCDPGPDIAGAVTRVVVAGFDFTVDACKQCGRDIPAYQIYQDFHAEHCPQIGPQREGSL